MSEQDQMAAAEAERQRGQAQPHADHLEGAQDEADARVEAAQAEQDIDPASPAGQQAAMRRGDPVQLQGDDLAGGHRFGTNTTHNESMTPQVAPQPGPQGHNFVTGAAGEPIPAGEGVVAERPSVGQMDLTLGEAGGEHPDEPARAPYEQSEADRIERADAEYAARSAGNESTEPPPKSALKADWVDHAEAQGVPREEAESMTKAELVEDPRLTGEGDAERDGAEGPGVSA